MTEYRYDNVIGRLIYCATDDAIIGLDVIWEHED